MTIEKILKNIPKPAKKAAIAFALASMIFCFGYDIYKSQAREIANVKNQICSLPKDKDYNAKAKKIIDSYCYDTRGDLINFAYKERDKLYDLLEKK